MQDIARRTQASFERTLADAKTLQRQATEITAGVARAAYAFAQNHALMQEEFSLVRACRAHVAGSSPKLSSRTVADYRKKTRRLEHWRPDATSPPDLTRCPSPNSYYPYRAALIWSAKEDIREGLRRREKLLAGGPELQEVICSLWRALLALDAYPASEQNIARFKAREAAAQLGLDDSPAICPLGKRNPRATKAKVASSLLRTQPEWSNKVWARLCAVQSPWLDQVAVLALTGCRPQEVFGAKVELAASGELVFLIQGAKTDAHKGQPWRKLTLRADRPEFTYLIERVRSSGALTLPLHQKLSDPADALCSAVKRAGIQALGVTAGFSAYVFRHSLAANLKADKADRESLALILGHSVTETASMYGFWQGGLKGVQQIAAVAEREVKVNHLHGKVTTPQPAHQPSPSSENSSGMRSTSASAPIPTAHAADEPKPC
jgi:integrase